MEIASTNKHHILHASELANLPPVAWLVEGMLPEGALCEIHGAPGAGKSLFALQLAATVAVDKPVLYVAAEGFSGYQARLAAWEHKNSTPKFLYFDFESVNLLDNCSVREFIQEAKRVHPSLIVIDTLARCMIGGDENSAKDMGLVIHACDEIRHSLETTLLVVHHTGKSGASERGSSALRGGCDSMIELSNDDGLITVSSSKLKDGRPFPTKRFRIIEVDGGVTLMPASKVVEEPKISEKQIALLDMLWLEIFREAGATYQRIKQHTGFSESTLNRMLSKLKEKGYIRQSKKGEPYFITEQGSKIVKP